MRILFIIKSRLSSAGDNLYAQGHTSGLGNSARFVVDMLNREGIAAKLVEVHDNNDIDREVHRYKPTHVVIEALWVVPEKFAVLQNLHPRVKWIIRGHSALPFLANEGIAIKWINAYVQHENVVFAPNSDEGLRDIRTVIGHLNPLWLPSQVAAKIPFLPNYYVIEHVVRPRPVYKQHVDVACFGAVRPLKNQLVQAVAAMEYAASVGKKLKFHVNGSRPEQGGDSNLSNIRDLFSPSLHELVLHPWMSHLKLLQTLAQCDVSLAVSFTETFCIVAADSVAAQTPLVCSNQIPWAAKDSLADPVSSADIVAAMHHVTGRDKQAIASRNMRRLVSYVHNAKHAWLEYLAESHS